MTEPKKQRKKPNRTKKSDLDLTTLKIPHTGTPEEIKARLEALRWTRMEQSKVQRMAYKMASDGLSEIQIRHDLKGRKINSELVDSWLIQSAIRRALGDFKTDFENDKRKGTSHAGHRVYGSRALHQKTMNPKLSGEERRAAISEFKQRRLRGFYSIGERLAKGNRRVSFSYDHITVHLFTGEEVTFPLPELRGAFADQFYAAVDMANAKLLAITVNIDENGIYISFERNKVVVKKPQKSIKGRHLGIDLNPNYVGVSIYSEKKQLIETKIFDLKELTGKGINHNKLKHEIREVAIQVGKMACHFQVEYLFVEELSFAQGDKGKGANFNRLTGNQFLHKEFKRMLAKYGKVVEVNAAYSSTIGNIVNDQYPDPIAASMEIARRGIESRVVKGSAAFYPPMMSHEVLARRKHKWKNVPKSACSSWITLHCWIKEAGVKYRVPVPEREQMRIFVTKSSRVFVY